jgi:hypothetical protein
VKLKAPPTTKETTMMKNRYPTEKDLMAALRAQQSARTAAVAPSRKSSTAVASKRRISRGRRAPICYPYFS